MRKAIVSTLLVGILLLTAGCRGANSSKNIQLAPEVPAASEVPLEPSGEQPAEPSGDLAIDERIGNAVKDAYTGIEIDAFIRERKAILPGAPVPVTVIVKNTGDETVDYVQGSGSYTLPDALFLRADGLQPVLSTDRLGAATMDFRTQELKPGEQLEFVLYVMAIEPNAAFGSYTIELYGDSGAYIAEENWDDIREKFPDLTPAEPGSYQGQAYFLYYTRNESGVSDFTVEPSGYAECDFPITVSR